MGKFQICTRSWTDSVSRLSKGSSPYQGHAGIGAGKQLGSDPYSLLVFASGTS
jgi:hypothetical protein